MTWSVVAVVLAGTRGESPGSPAAWLAVASVFWVYAIISVTQRDRIADWLYRATGDETFNREAADQRRARLLMLVVLPVFAALFALVAVVAALWTR